MWRCTKCRVPLSEEERDTHYKSNWHTYNVRRHVALKAPLSKAEFDEKILEFQRKEQKEHQKKSVIYKCTVCKKTFKSEQTCEQHMKSKKHKDKVKKASQKLGRELLISEIIQSKVINDDIDTESQASSQAIPLQNIPLLSCLFCPHESENLSDSLEHMLHSHNFYIPFLELCTSVEGLLMFLGRFIGEQGTCINCHKSFHSLEGVWHHMCAKDHTRIALYEDSPLEEFYNFNQENGSISDMSTENESLGELTVVESKRRPAAINEWGELVLGDGSRLGHRQYRRIYDQAVRLPDSRACVVIPRLTARYKALCMPGYGLPPEQEKMEQHKAYTKQMNNWKAKCRSNHNDNYFKIYT